MKVEVDLYRKGDNEKTIEIESSKELGREYIEKAAKEIFTEPLIEETEAGFLVSGRTKGLMLEIDPKKGRIIARYSVYIGENDAGGLSEADFYSAAGKKKEIEKTLRKHF